MNHKVLLADDSLTIQKVIKITLANEPYDLIDCNNDDELFAKLNSDKPSMVFLDFNLSEKKSGYELCRELKKKKSDLKVLMLFGTFDNIDESQLRDCGASGKVIKPFDSNKFINTCKMIIQELDEPAEVQEEKIETEELDNDDNWSVSSPEIEDKTEDEVSSEDTIPQEMVVVKNKLEEHVEDWSGGVETPKFQEMRAPKGDDGETLIMPEEDDLEYPEIDQGPKFVDMDELKTKDDENEISFDEKTEDLALQLETEGTDSEEEVASLEAQISDETDADLWAVDMEIPKDESFDAPSIPEPIESVTEHQEEIMANVPSEQELDYPEPIEDVLPPVEESLSHFPREELENKLRPVIEEFVKEYCRESIEKVAWEIIPDLAENLIKQELARIANSVMDNR